MKKLLLITLAIVAMGGLANAQSCGDNDTYGTRGPCAEGSLCGCQNGSSDCAGPSCVNLQTSRNNCGSLGNKCSVEDAELCQNGVCVGGGGNIGPILPSKPRHGSIVAAVRELLRKES